MLCQLLHEQLHEHISFKIPDGGFAVWVNYLHGIKAKEVSEKAAAMGLSVGNGTGYFHDATYAPSSVRLGFAALAPKELETATGILTAAVKKLL